MNSTQDHSDYLFRHARHLIDPSSTASWGHSAYVSSSDAASRLCNKAQASSCLRSTSLININDDGRLAAGADPAIYSDPSTSQRSETAVKELRQSSRNVSELDAGRPTVQRPLLGPETQHFYIGALTRAEAEDAVKRRTTFRLYHQWDPSVTVLERLPLTIIYRSSRGKHYHFLVRSEGKVDQARGGYVPATYFVETGGPQFTHIRDLVVRYSNNTYIRGDDMDSFYVPLE
ncbi:hypothetical protein AAVH_01523 [Aphelenchoides avenae]|nr:hypothetical protein AAVH_01523 [Aphelenchus avenae]